MVRDFVSYYFKYRQSGRSKLQLNYQTNGGTLVL